MCQKYVLKCLQSRNMDEPKYKELIELRRSVIGLLECLLGIIAAIFS